MSAGYYCSQTSGRQDVHPRREAQIRGVPQTVRGSSQSRYRQRFAGPQAGLEHDHRPGGELPETGAGVPPGQSRARTSAVRRVQGVHRSTRARARSAGRCRSRLITPEASIRRMATHGARQDGTERGIEVR